MKKLILAICLTAGWMSAAQADPIVYDLSGYEFLGGNGTITGNFTVDTDTGAVTDVNIAVSGGNLVLCTNDPNVSNCGAGDIDVVDTFDPILLTADVNLFMRTPTGADPFHGFAFTSGLSGTTSQFVFQFAGLFPPDGGTLASSVVAQWQCPTQSFCERNVYSTPFRTAVTGSVTARPVPEPAVVTLLGLGLLGIGLARRRRKD